MSSEEVASWLTHHAEILGVNLPAGVTVKVVDYITDGFGNKCDDPTCGGKSDPISGYFDPRTNTIVINKLEWVRKNSATVFDNYLKNLPANLRARVESGEMPSIGIQPISADLDERVIHTFIHEAAHANGIDVDQKQAHYLHPNAEKAARAGVKRYRELFKKDQLR